MNSLPDADPRLHVVVLAGGTGSRFWPASTPARPKPVLSLGSSGTPLIVETMNRAGKLADPDKVSILAGEHLSGPFRAALPDLDPSRLWIEPEARGTAPVLAWAAHRIFRQDPAAAMISLHSDHTIEPEDAFAALLREGAALALREDLLLTVAVPPTRPETGYGYIRPGMAIGTTVRGSDAAEAFRVDAFVEKPDAETAGEYLQEGYLWNSGIFVFPVARFLEEIRQHAPEIGNHLELLDEGKVEEFFDRVPSISVDEAVLERTSRIGALRATFQWDDVGNWEAIARTTAPDPGGNYLRGKVHCVETWDSIAWAEDGPVVIFGLEGVVVVRSNGITLVTTRTRATDLKRLIASLPEDLREGRTS